MDKNMIIKVCGMREADNIRAVAELDIDMMGFIFYPKSERFVRMISSQAGIIPDYSRERLDEAKGQTTVETAGERRPMRVGVFADDMPQNIITRIYNYHLDCVQLHGEESTVMIDNLRRSVDPDIRPGLRIIKTIPVATADDVRRANDYEGHADMLLFDTRCEGHGGSGRHFDHHLLDAYDGTLPFLLSGGIGPDDAQTVRSISHPRFAGIDLNSRFETAPALKDVELLRRFISEVRA